MHQKLILVYDLPYKYTISDESVIKIKYPPLDTNKCIDTHFFKELPSKLKLYISIIHKNDEISSDEFSSSREEIGDAQKRDQSFFSSSGNQLISIKLKCIIRNSLKKVQIDDCMKFHLIDYMLNGNSIDYLETNDVLSLIIFLVI